MYRGGVDATDGGFDGAAGLPAHASTDLSPGEAGRSLAPTHEPNPTRPRHRLTTSRLRRSGPSSAEAPGIDAAQFVAPPESTSWVGKYQVGLVAIDWLAGALGIVLAYYVRFGIPGTGSNPTLYVTVGILLPVSWVAVVAFNRAYESRFIGAGATEFQRIFRAFLHLVALIAFVSYATQADLARGFILLAVAFALAFDVAGRYAARKYLHTQRSTGRAMRSVLAVGDCDSVIEFAALLRRDRYAGMQVVGACVPGEIDDTVAATLDEIDIPVLGSVDAVLDSARFIGAHTVAVLSSSQISPENLRWISWQLEDTDTSLVVSPGLTEVAGPRLHIQPVAGLPLLHVEQPEFTGFRRFLKSTLDRSVAAIALLILSPVLMSIAAAVRLTSRGPAFFHQTRVGRDGRTFTMIKFRSMYVDAEARLEELRAQNHNADGLLFKMRDDPRVTRVGRILRRFSLDELPQLINIVTGAMSVVGPRPPVRSEVERYGDDVRRRLLVKPGLTGLWQVSGRSDLSWDESIRLDLRYVENWSPALDLMILWKTLFAVLGRSGAY